MKNSNLHLAAALLLAASATASAAPNIQDGLWEITTKTEMQGMPMAMPTVKHTACLSQKDAVPQKPEKDQKCRITSNKIEGNTVTWGMECRDKGQVIRSSGKVSYSGSSFSGTSHTTIEQPGEGKMQMTNHMSGKRIGDCKQP